VWRADDIGGFLITLVRYVFSILIWAVVAAILLFTGKIVYLMFWAILGAFLVMIWLGHMVYRVVYLFNPDFKAIKIIFFFAILIIVAIGYFKIFVAPSWNNWGSTPEEIDRDYDADLYCPEADIRTVRTMEVNAPPEYIFRWVRQLPEDESYGWSFIEFGGKEELGRLMDNLPELSAGNDFLIGRVVKVETGKSITFDIGSDPKFPKLGINCMYGGYYFQDAGKNRTRINVVMRADYDGFWGWFYSQIIIEIGDFFVAKKHLARVKRAAEQHLGFSE
jgi:hypothetical protein